jgi:hypothetical protein
MRDVRRELHEDERSYRAELSRHIDQLCEAVADECRTMFNVSDLPAYDPERASKAMRDREAVEEAFVNDTDNAPLACGESEAA